MVKKKFFIMIIPTVIDCAIMKCGGCENRTKTKPNLTKPKQIYPNLTLPNSV